MERFVMSKNRNDISILDTGHDLVKEEGNALIFDISLEDNDIVADYLAYELKHIIKILNEQNKIIESNNKNR